MDGLSLQCSGVGPDLKPIRPQCAVGRSHLDADSLTNDNRDNEALRPHFRRIIGTAERGRSPMFGRLRVRH